MVPQRQDPGDQVNRLPVLTGILLALAACAPARGVREPGLEGDVREALASVAPEARLSLWLADVDGREILSLAADRPLPAASVVKVLILVEAHARALEGAFDWNERHVLRESELTVGSGSLQRERPGTEWTLRRLAEKMIVESDNTAANILLRRLGMDRVNARARALGLTRTRLTRPFLDLEAQAAGRENWTTAREMGRLVLAIYRGEVLSPDASGEMAALMERAGRRGIAAGVPEDIRVGHKSGWLPGLRHDVGWVRAHDRPYVLAVMLEGVIESRSGDRGREALEAVARAVARALITEP